MLATHDDILNSGLSSLSISSSIPASSLSTRPLAHVDKQPDKEEHELLQHQSLDAPDSSNHELKTAPIFTRDAYVATKAQQVFPQRGLLGSVMEIYDKNGANHADTCHDNRLYLNTNAPLSALVCGVQGSGKSHTVSIVLEDMLIPKCSRIGALNKALSGLVLHFGEGGPYSLPCEAAWVGASESSSIKLPPVHVYASNSSLNTMKTVYAPLGSRVTVQPLLFSESELDAQAFLSMMAIGASDHVPLYMQTVLSILRQLGESYSYTAFKKELNAMKVKFMPPQLSGLEQRMALLEAFLEKPKSSKKQRAAPPRFAAGQLTIIDLSDPFIDPASASGLFEIIVRLFVRAKVDTGKVLVVDEAHKYLSPDKTSSGLTKELLSLIRQQRHQAMRVVISTQEPTVVPAVLLDLCSVAILHRFSSPAWWDHVAKHVSADIDSKEAFDKVVNLKTGQALLLAPSGLAVSRLTTQKAHGTEVVPTLRQFGRKSVLIRTRQRVTKDGGASILVVET